MAALPNCACSAVFQNNSLERSDMGCWSNCLLQAMNREQDSANTIYISLLIVIHLKINIYTSADFSFPGIASVIETGSKRTSQIYFRIIPAIFCPGEQIISVNENGQGPQFYF